MPEGKTLGQVGYEAYGEAAGWKTWRGDPMPRWEELKRTISGGLTQLRWETAALAVVVSADKGQDTERHFRVGQIVKIDEGAWGLVVDVEALHSNTEDEKYMVAPLQGGFWTDGTELEEVTDA